MAEDRSGAPALNTNIEHGGFDEKRHDAPHNTAPPPATTKAPAADDDDEDEDIDALIEDLESQDGHVAIDEEEEEVNPGLGRTIPEEMLQTDSRVGLTETEVTNRRRKYGLNQMKEEKENLILKFLGYFVGPIQFVMEVSLLHAYNHTKPFSAHSKSPLASSPCGLTRVLLPFRAFLARAFFLSFVRSQITGSTQASLLPLSIGRN